MAQNHRNVSHFLAVFTGFGAILGGAAAGPARGQDAPQSADALQEVVVTGYRNSLAAALNIKRAEAGVVDAIVAEDIANFPDLNLSESLQRIPGVSIARDAGEGRNISVRGLGGQFTRVRINGLEAMSANGGSDAAGGTNRSRTFDFNTFASELFNSITVRKSSSADLEEGSLGATVDLRAARPFDYDRFTLVGSFQQGYNDLSGKYDPRGAALVSNTWGDGRFGALLSVAYTKRNVLDEGASTVRWQQSDVTAAGTGCPNPAAPATTCFGALEPGYSSAPTYAQINRAFHPRIPRLDTYVHEQERLGVTTALQWAPSDRSLLSVDVLYAKFEATRREIFLESPVFSTNGAAAINNVNPVAAFIDSSNSLVYGVFNDVDIRSEVRADELSTEFTQVDLEFKHGFSDTLRLNAFAGFAESNHENPVQTTLLFDRADVDGYSFDFRDNSRLPLFTYGNVDVASPSTWTLSQIRLRPQSTLNNISTASIELEWEVNDTFTLKAGPQWKEFTVKSTATQRSNGSSANQESVIPMNVATTPVANYSTLATTGKDLDLPAGSITSWLVPDIAAANELFGLNDRTVFPIGIQPVLGNNFEVEETGTGAFLQLDIATEVAGVPLRGNLGVRHVETRQAALGYTFVAGAPRSSVVERTYSHTLPSFNLTAEFRDDFLVRASAAKVMSRPDLLLLNPGAAVSIAGSNKTVTAGNPLLEPFEADSFDLSFEWYFGEQSLLSLGLFYKKIASFVQTVRATDSFSSNTLGLPDSVALAACNVQAGTPAAATCLADWQFSLPANTPGGPLQGFEINYQQPLSFLPGPFRNLGIQLNYTGVKSEIDLVDLTGAVVLVTDLQGLSKSAYNATLYYENDRFGARISAAYRDEYLTTAPGRNGNSVEGTNETFNVDFSSSFNLTDQVSFTFEALNLTDEFDDQWVDSAGDRLSYYHHQGRQFFLGARFKY